MEMARRSSNKVKKLIWNEFYKKHTSFLGTLVYYARTNYHIDAEKAFLHDLQLFKKVVTKIYGELGWQLFIEEAIAIAQKLKINIQELEELINTI